MTTDQGRTSEPPPLPADLIEKQADRPQRSWMLRSALSIQEISVDNRIVWANFETRQIFLQDFA